ncbi:MAG: 5-oxoprolinase subunit PxpA [Eubacterium sp.]
MLKIDLNCDLGEGAGLDSRIIPLITSANVACGFHAGDCETMNKTVELCRASGIAVGAHPGYPDRENFGRTNIPATQQQVYDYTIYQLGALDAFCRAQGIEMQHIKPHGAMYNMAAKDKALSQGIARAVYDYNRDLILLGLSGSLMIDAAQELGIKTASEVFADRAYEEDGSLRARSLEGSMITDEKLAISRVIRMIKEGKVTAYSGKDIDIKADSVCVHGDGEKALEFVEALNKAFMENNIKTAKISEVVG